MKPKSVKYLLGPAFRAAEKTAEVAAPAPAPAPKSAKFLLGPAFTDPQPSNPSRFFPSIDAKLPVSLPLPVSLSLEKNAKAASKYFPKGDVQKPNPEEFKAPLERVVRGLEMAEDQASNLQGATAVALTVADKLGKALPAAVAKTNVGLRAASMPAITALAAMDAGRVISSPEYRAALEQDAARILAQRSPSKLGQLKQDVVEMAGYLGRPLSAGKVFFSALNQTHTDAVNSALKAQSSRRQAREMQRKIAEQVKQTPKVESLANQKPKFFSRFNK